MIPELGQLLIDAEALFYPVVEQNNMTESDEDTMTFLRVPGHMERRVVSPWRRCMLTLKRR